MKIDFNENKEFINAFRNTVTARNLVKKIEALNTKPITLMEVCGTHTMAICRYGIHGLLPDNIRLISGPGCPVCVTPVCYIDAAAELANRDGTIIATFGDLMRVPGTKTSLLKEKAQGCDVRIVYSPLDALQIAADNKDKRVVFLSVGFETTTPIIALTVLNAQKNNLLNFSVLTANKTMPEALKLLSSDKETGIDGYIYPGHVSAVTGTELYEELAFKYGIPGVVAGFEPVDILDAILLLASNINKGLIVVENRYSRIVRSEGNIIAKERMNEVFEPYDAVWRGIGTIPGSGLRLRRKFAEFDASGLYNTCIKSGMTLEKKDFREPPGCLCGEILKGKKKPSECTLFGNACTPENPYGACMVSSEGTCAAYYKYIGRAL